MSLKRDLKAAIKAGSDTALWRTAGYASPGVGYPVLVQVPVPFCNVIRSVTTFAAAGRTDYQVRRVDPET